MSEQNVPERFSDALYEFVFFHQIFFNRSRPCSHLFAVLRLLVDFINPKVNTLLVRHALMFWLN
jgi:hypothetical protein